MKKFQINEIMSPTEACERWGISPDNFRKTIERNPDKIDDLVEKGLLKYYQRTPSSRKKWIITPDAMEKLFHKKDGVKNNTKIT